MEFCPHCGHRIRGKAICPYCGPDVCWWFNIPKLVEELGVGDQIIVTDDDCEDGPLGWIKDNYSGDGRYHPMEWISDNYSGDGRYYPLGWVRSENDGVYRPWDWALQRFQYY